MSIEASDSANAASGSEKLPCELLDLARRCEAATGPDRDLDLAIELYLEGGKYDYPADNWVRDSLHFTASLDAAMTLVPEGWTRTVKWSVENEGYALVYDPAAPDDTSIWAIGKTAALALCAASLRSRAHPLKGD